MHYEALPQWPLSTISTSLHCWLLLLVHMISFQSLTPNLPSSRALNMPFVLPYLGRWHMRTERTGLEQLSRFVCLGHLYKLYNFKPSVSSSCRICYMEINNRAQIIKLFSKERDFIPVKHLGIIWHVVSSRYCRTSSLLPSPS